MRCEPLARHPPGPEKHRRERDHHRRDEPEQDRVVVRIAWSIDEGQHRAPERECREQAHRAEHERARNQAGKPCSVTAKRIVRISRQQRQCCLRRGIHDQMAGQRNVGNGHEPRERGGPEIRSDDVSRQVRLHAADRGADPERQGGSDQPPGRAQPRARRFGRHPVTNLRAAPTHRSRNVPAGERTERRRRIRGCRQHDRTRSEHGRGDERHAEQPVDRNADRRAAHVELALKQAMTEIREGVACPPQRHDRQHRERCGFRREDGADRDRNADGAEGRDQAREHITREI